MARQRGWREGLVGLVALAGGCARAKALPTVVGSTADASVIAVGAPPSPRALEELAARSQRPALVLVRAARAWRSSATALAQRASQAPAREADPATGSVRGLVASTHGEVAAELQAREEANFCANDARAAWTGSTRFVQAAVESGAAFADVLGKLGAPAAEALYLDAACTALWARLTGFVKLAERQSELRQMFERAGALAPGLDEAGPDRELGQLFAQLPASAGGDLALARARFEQSLARAPGSLVTRVRYARSVAVKLQDRALFTRLLGEALELPAETPEGRAAKAEAEVLLAQTAELFGE